MITYISLSFFLLTTTGMYIICLAPEAYQQHMKMQDSRITGDFDKMDN